MCYEEKRVRELLQEHQATFVRSNKHEVWKLPNGVDLLVLPSTPSDYRSWKNALAFLLTALGLNDENRGTPGERRERRVHMERPIEEAQLEAPKLSSMATGMVGVMQHVKAIKHPVHHPASPATRITVDVSGLLSKFGGAR